MLKRCKGALRSHATLKLSVVAKSFTLFDTNYTKVKCCSREGELNNAGTSFHSEFHLPW